MVQRVRVQNFTVSEDGYGAGEGQSLERPFGHADPTELIAWGFDTASWPGRTDGAADSWARRLLHSRLRKRDRRRDHGPQQVRPPTRTVGRPRVGGLVGRHTAVSHPGVRAHAPRAPIDHARRHHVPLPQCDTGRGRRASKGRRGRTRRPPRRRCDHRPFVHRRRSCRRAPRRRRSRSPSAAASDSGNPPTSSTNGSTTKPSRAPAVSPTTSSGVTSHEPNRSSQ